MCLRKRERWDARNKAYAPNQSFLSSFFFRITSESTTWRSNVARAPTGPISISASTRSAVRYLCWYRHEAVSRCDMRPSSNSNDYICTGIQICKCCSRHTPALRNAPTLEVSKLLKVAAARQKRRLLRRGFCTSGAESRWGFAGCLGRAYRSGPLLCPPVKPSAARGKN